MIDRNTDKYITFDCNEWYEFHNFVPNYWVMANTQYTIQRYYDIMNEYMIPVLYADSVDLSDRTFIENNLKCDYLPYDQRHFNSSKCGCGNCCNHIIQNRKTIQEELQSFTNYEKRYGSGDTCVLHSIAFAVLMGCNPIYITGMDLDYKNGYANNKINMGNIATIIDPYYDRIIEDLNTINNSAKKIGTEIINLNTYSTFDILKIGGLNECL